MFYDPPEVTAGRRRALAQALATYDGYSRSPCGLCEDLAWLLDTGEQHRDQLATRLGITYRSILKHVRRHDRDDLRRRLDNLQQQAA